jgi:murein DD-endopeptidase MepM/ murein hydrolase activator NlpD
MLCWSPSLEAQIKTPPIKADTSEQIDSSELEDEFDPDETSPENLNHLEDLADDTLDVPVFVPTQWIFPGLEPDFDMYYNWDTSAIDPYRYDLRRIKEQYHLVILQSDCGYQIPIRNRVNSKFGWRRGRLHAGIDLQLRIGDTVRAAFDGVVRLSEYHGGYGNCVMIRHYNGIETLYGHLSLRLVQPGDLVNAGQVIGLGGSTGRSTGPHLHFETRFLGRPFDPQKTIDFGSDTLKTNVLIISQETFKIPNSGKYYKKRRYKKRRKRKPKRRRRAEIYHEWKFENFAKENSTNLYVVEYHS